MSEKENLNFEDHKNCSEAAQIDQKINLLEKIKIDIDGLKENHKELIRNKKIKIKKTIKF